jgi:hypothetical protein
MAKPNFSLLWTAYPSDRSPCDQGWANQCAIRLSVALEGAGAKLAGYTEPRCKHGHARGAESLAQYLVKHYGMPVIKKNAGDARVAVANKTGIVFFKDIAGFRGGIGDHIDLWKNDVTKTGEYFGSCKQTWFWSLK